MTFEIGDLVTPSTIFSKFAQNSLLEIVEIRPSRFIRCYAHYSASKTWLEHPDQLYFDPQDLVKL